jgi:hypothetical protein
MPIARSFTVPSPRSQPASSRTWPMIAWAPVAMLVSPLIITAIPTT